MEVNSYPILTGKEASDWDKTSISKWNVESRLLMGWAGYAAFQYITTLDQFKSCNTIHFLNGSGNNGGDGYVIAWHTLTLQNKKIKIWKNGDPKTSDAIYFYNLCKSVKNNIEIAELESFTAGNVAENDIIIDSLFGTGLNKEPSPDIQTLFNVVNNIENIFRIAIDIPSGVYSDGSKFSHTSFKADETISFGSFKIGHLIEPGILFSGKVTVFPIGFYPEARPPRSLILKQTIPALRKENGHKYSNGVLTIAGGSAGMEGAAILAAKTFLGLGGGLVKLFSTSPDIKKSLGDFPEVMINQCTQNDLEKNLSEHLSASEKYQVLVIGVGLAEELSDSFWETVLEMPKISIIIDGSLLGNIYRYRKTFSKHKIQKLILTPHSGEAEKLLNRNINNVRTDAIEIAREYNCDVYFKGPGGILVKNGNPAKEIYINSRAYQLGTGGSGDVLAGVIGNMMFRNTDSPVECALQIYLDAANDISVKFGSKDFCTPGEIIEELRNTLVDK